MELSGAEVARGRFLCIGFMTITGRRIERKTYPGPRAALVTESGRVFPITQSVLKIGRRDTINGIFPDIDLSAEDGGRYVSRRHARILYHDGQWLLVAEPGAKNGTYLNKRALPPGKGARLRNGDHLRLAAVEAVFRSKVG